MTESRHLFGGSILLNHGLWFIVTVILLFTFTIPHASTWWAWLHLDEIRETSDDLRGRLKDVEAQIEEKEAFLTMSGSSSKKEDIEKIVRNISKLRSEAKRSEQELAEIEDSLVKVREKFAAAPEETTWQRIKRFLAIVADLCGIVSGAWLLITLILQWYRKHKLIESTNEHSE